MSWIWCNDEFQAKGLGFTDVYARVRINLLSRVRIITFKKQEKFTNLSKTATHHQTKVLAVTIRYPEHSVAQIICRNTCNQTAICSHVMWNSVTFNTSNCSVLNLCKFNFPHNIYNTVNITWDQIDVWFYVYDLLYKSLWIRGTKSGPIACVHVIGTIKFTKTKTKQYYC